MKKITKHFVIEYSPSFISCESQEREIESRESFIPCDDTYCYRFFDRNFVLDEDGEVYTGKSLNFSPFYYEGEVLDIEKAKIRGTPVLVENMRINEIERVVLTKYNTAHILRDDDVVLRNFNERKYEKDK